jgi:hypothetical protein
VYILQVASGGCALYFDIKKDQKQMTKLSKPQIKNRYEFNHFHVQVERTHLVMKILGKRPQVFKDEKELFEMMSAWIKKVRKANWEKRNGD